MQRLNAEVNKAVKDPELTIPYGQSGKGPRMKHVAGKRVRACGVCRTDLHVTEGEGLVQRLGGGREPIRAGDTVQAEAGEWHWHGAGPGTFMTHLAVQEADDHGQTTYWGEHVTDDEYRG